MRIKKEGSVVHISLGRKHIQRLLAEKEIHCRIGSYDGKITTEFGELPYNEGEKIATPGVALQAEQLGSVGRPRFHPFDDAAIVSESLDKIVVYMPKGDLQRAGCLDPAGLGLQTSSIPIAFKGLAWPEVNKYLFGTPNVIVVDYSKK
jgi:hypothetical protein